MKTMNKKVVFLLGVLFFSISCSEEFLEPKALSFYAPENTYVNAEGMRAALVPCSELMRTEWISEGRPLLTEYIFSEVAVHGTTDRTDPAQNMNVQITPDAELYDGGSFNSIGDYWSNGYKSIKYANTVITRIDDAEYASQEERNEILGLAYFFRAYNYYRLTQQFGDVPLILKEVTQPKTDYYSTEREVILKKMKEDLEFAAQWVPETADMGEVNRGAVNHILTKVNLALGEFDDAIQSANYLINGNYALMTERFGSYKKDPTRNVIWDLHRIENKYLKENTERIMLVMDREDMQGGSKWGGMYMRGAVPAFWRNIATPSGYKGTTDSNSEYDLVNTYGRGIARLRSTIYHMKTIWTDTTDLRHADGNWIEMEDLVYNNPQLKDMGDPWYGKHLQLYSDDGKLLCLDTIYSWYSWPHYKLYVPDPNNVVLEGGRGDWYAMRLAETYLLRAEAYWWKGDLENAAADINAVRERAHAVPLESNQINIGTILDERARELYFEEWRKTEMTRICYLLCKTGKPGHNGKVYKLENFSEDNYWYDRIMEYGDFYNKGVVTINGKEFTMSPYHVLWPIPAAAIRANTTGHINQNIGYSGSESNIPPLTEIGDE
jgi:hypothetical protein